MASYYDNSDSGQRFQPGTTARADAVDSKFDAVATGFSEVADDVARALKLPDGTADQTLSETAMQRRGGTVGFDQDGNITLTKGFAWRGDWATSTDYQVNNVFRDPVNEDIYVVLEAHTSSSIASDVSSGYIEKGIAVGDMTAVRDATIDARDDTFIARDTTQGYRDTAEDYKDSAEAAAAAAQAAAGLPSLVGNGGKSLKAKEDESGVEWGPGLISEYQEFTASGTWNKDPNAQWVYVEAIGGGQGGGNHDSSSASGGSGGGYANKLLRASDVTSTVSVTVGAGSAGTSGSPYGNAASGGDSAFGSYLTARGGQRADSITPIPGTGGGGERHPDGGAGGYSSGQGSRGNGGDSMMGGAGGGGNTGAGGVSVNAGDGGAGASGANGGDGQWPGGGGGGAKDSGFKGGDGGDGVVRVWQW